MPDSDTEKRQLAVMWDFLVGYRANRCATRVDAEAIWDTAMARHNLTPAAPAPQPAKERWWKSAQEGSETRWHLRADGTIQVKFRGEEWSSSVAKISDLETDTLVIETDAHGTPLGEKGERTRWFRDSGGAVREYPSRRTWDYKGAIELSPTIFTIDGRILAGDTELDGPPPHGRPLAVPEATGAGPLKWGAEIVQRDDGDFDVVHGTWELDSPRDISRHDYAAFWRSNMNENAPKGQTIGWFGSYEKALAALSAAPAPPGRTEPATTRDGMEERATEAWVAHGGDGVPGPVRLVKFARSETSALAAENERLRGELETATQAAERNLGAWHHDARTKGLKKRIARLTKPSPRRAPARGKTGRTKRKDRP